MGLTPFSLLVPLIAAMIGVAVNRKAGIAKYIALGGAVASLALYPFIGGDSSLTWFTVGGSSFALTAMLKDSTTSFWLVTLPILVIGCLVLLYSSWFMDLPSEQRRYYIGMLAFEAAMLAFVMAADFILFFVAWEFLSLSSYLLIGFWHSRDRAIAAARKAMTIVLIGDIALLASIVILQASAGTLDFAKLLGMPLAYPVRPMVTALLLVAIFTKSAQFPFHEWLPDAMEGPTPVSAYLHSSTMVKAGVFASLVLFSLFTQQELSIILLVGVVTAVLSMLNAMRERQIKRVLAYSTVQELSLMMIAVSAGALVAAVYFFFVQGFYKALLFFSAGVSMKATDKESLGEVSGIRQNRIVYITTLFGVLGLAGFVPFAGFFANLGIGFSFGTNLVVYALLSLISAGTSFYIFRWIVLQLGKQASASASLGYGTVPKTVMFVMIVLAILTLPLLTPSGLGFRGVYEAILETALVAVGAFAAYRIYRQTGRRASKATMRVRALNWNLIYSAGAVNFAYLHFARFVISLADGFSYFDARLSGLFDWLGHAAVGSGAAARRIAAGSINAYAAIFAAGLLLLVLMVAVFG